VVDHARERGLATGVAAGFRNHPGLGVEAEVAGRRVLVGSRRFLAAQGVATDGAVSPSLALDGRLAGVFRLEDPPRPEAAEAVEALRRAGLRVLVLTGDAEAPARRAAEAVGISEVVAEADPAGKVEAVRRLRAEGEVVAMVGDGVNDAAALATADLGIALATGSDVAVESAPVSLLRPDLGLVGEALELGRRTVRTIRENLAWAFLFNVVGIPVAAAGRLDPVLACGAMSLSSLLVVANALRLRGRRGRLPGRSRD
ncbi:MAG: HAD-IC family P-type ATPase, partial [Planctomycetes bacterium]|nr:HAD-IC family P-type ATPase [Planctomycetota bacterium]